MMVYDVSEFASASSGSVIRLLPQPNDSHPYYADRDVLALVVDAINNQAPLHISGESGTGKSHFLNSLMFGPITNFFSVCAGLDQNGWNRFTCHRIFISSYELPSEVWFKTEVVKFSTVERPQKIMEVLRGCQEDPRSLHIIWLVESGRGVSPSVQGGFLEIIGQRTIRAPNGEVLEAGNVTFVTDSNHAANQAGEFAIWDLDRAYGRRFVRRITLEPLTPIQETLVLRELRPNAPPEQIQNIVCLAGAIRAKQREGALVSILPPSIDAELDLLDCMSRMGWLKIDTRKLAFSTLLGHCSEADREETEDVYGEVFGVRVKTSTPAGQAVGIL